MRAMPPLPSHLRIYPSRLAMDRAATPAAKTCVVASDRTTFAALVDALGSPQDASYAEAYAGQLIVRAALWDLEGKQNLAATDPWSVRAVYQALMVLRRAGITAQHLRGKSAREDVQHLTRVLGDYERVLETGRLFDDADRARHAVYAVVRGTLPTHLAEVRRITVEGGASLFDSRLDLLSAFAVRNVAVEIRLPYDVSRPEPFGWPEASLHSLEARRRDNLMVVFDARAGCGALAPLRQAMFTHEVVRDAPCRVLQFARTREHSLGIARLCRRWIDAGVPPQEIAVAVTDIHGFGDEIRAAGETYGVPMHARGGPALRDISAVSSLLTALGLPSGGYRRESLIDVYLAAGPTVRTSHGPWGPQRIATALRDADVRFATLAGVRRQLRTHAQRLANRHGGGDALADADAIADAIEQLLEPLLRLPENGPFTAFVQPIEDLLARWLQATAARPLPTVSTTVPSHKPLWRHLAQERRAIEAVADLFARLAQAAALAETVLPGPAWHRDEVVGTLALLLAHEHLPPPGLQSAAVTVLTPADLVETRYSRVCLAGVDAGTFPRSAAPDPVLTDAVRAEINRHLGPKLLQRGPLQGRGALRGDAQDRWLWLEMLAAAQDELVVTYNPGDGEDTNVRSEFVDELLARSGVQVEIPPASHRDIPHTPRELLSHWSHATAPAQRHVRERDASWIAALDAAVRDAMPAAVACTEQRLQREAWRACGHPTGSLLPPSARQTIEQALFGRVVSTSNLDTLAMCGYRHFAQTILGLQGQTRKSLGPDPREEGSAAHAALHVVYAAFIRAGGLQRWRGSPEAALELARETFNTQVEAILHDVQVHPLLRHAALERAWETVATQVQRDLCQTDTWEPIALEHRFDDRFADATPPLEIPSDDGTRVLRVRGSIDRVDRCDGALATLDYKRSKQKRQMLRHLQLPIYAAVAHRDFASGGPTRGCAAWITFADGKRHTPEDIPEDADRQLQTLHQLAWTRVERLLAGEIAPDPAPASTCERCDFRPLCRYLPPPADDDADHLDESKS